MAPEQFKHYETYGKALGIPHLYAGPFIRSSYNAALLKDQAFELARIPHHTPGKLGTSASPNIPGDSLGNVYKHSPRESLEISKKQTVQSSSRAGEEYGLARIPPGGSEGSAG